jgi:putative transposase
MHVCKLLHISERRACRVLGQARATQRHISGISGEEDRLTDRIIELATKYGRYGYRRITALLRSESWRVNHKRVERIWRREGPKVPKKQPKRGRLWLNDSLCVRLRPEYKDHVWNYDFVMARTADGRAFRILTILDEFTRDCLIPPASWQMSPAPPSICFSSWIPAPFWIILPSRKIHTMDGPVFREQINSSYMDGN